MKRVNITPQKEDSSQHFRMPYDYRHCFHSEFRHPLKMEILNDLDSNLKLFPLIVDISTEK